VPTNGEEGGGGGGGGGGGDVQAKITISCEGRSLKRLNDWGLVREREMKEMKSYYL
jgi:hypothetical protein